MPILKLPLAVFSEIAGAKRYIYGVIRSRAGAETSSALRQGAITANGGPPHTYGWTMLWGAALGRAVIYINNVSGLEWKPCPYPPEVHGSLSVDGHENKLGGDTGKWCG